MELKSQSLTPHGYSMGGMIANAIGGVGSLPPFPSDDYWMAQALLAAMQAPGISLPNPTVGATIVKNNQMLSRGVTEPQGLRHAEVVALDRLASTDQAHGSTIYVTLEPCAHFGRQPPCVDRIIAAGIKRCVYGLGDPYSEVDGRGISRLRHAGIEVSASRLERACFAWHHDYLARQQAAQKLPVFYGKWAQTIDGSMADDLGESKWITAEPARAYGHWLRQKYDGILVGARTVLKDYPQLTARDCPHIVRQPLRIIVDPKGRLKQASSNDQDRLRASTFSSISPVIIVVSNSELSHSQASWLGKLGHHVQVIATAAGADPSDFFADLDQTLAQPAVAALWGRPLASVYVEGGAVVLNQLWLAQKFAGAHILIAPSLLGGKKNRVFHFPERESRSCGQMQRYRLLASQPVGSDVLVEMVADHLF